MSYPRVPTDEELGVVIAPIVFMINYKTGLYKWEALLPLEVDIYIGEGYDVVSERVLIDFLDRKYDKAQKRLRKNLLQKLRRQQAPR
ncbi:hypothetical protein [Edaphovirga cremea]|uniref:hypothetical protein n=1 Tax=Edaphovirga cremea TaxID=2267246 RepID=UPI00398964A1